jgi:G3E family GTPase
VRRQKSEIGLNTEHKKLNTSIPVLVLTGYLGAGKTTLLNHLLSLPGIRAKKIALIINEFGPLGIDGKLVAPGDYAKFELNKGSLFCICIKTDFIRTLETIANEVKPDLVIVEATGVADPCDLSQLVDSPHLREVFQIGANVCLADAVGFTQVAAFLRTAKRQVMWADGLVINKSDLVPATDLSALAGILKELNPEAPQITVSFGKISETFLQGLTHRVRLAPIPEAPAAELASASLQTEKPVDEKRFFETIASLKGSLLRLKGTVCFPNRTRFVEVVNGRVTEKDPPAGLPRTAFTVIGWKIPKDDLVSAFSQCW